ncbi:general vesicular transport factor p115-like [Tubulanus polymorphus]|uniref:general vesicular transport factor p115-like n=1 Tax=Tubulanus polymorphus TaxID=672921 RepID=UPI003DA45A5E
MDYFRKYLGANQESGGQPTGAETVERLCDRVQSSTLLDDRRDAVRALKSLSRKYCLEVGTQSMEILLNVLAVDRGDPEIIGYALETLCNIMSNEPNEEQDNIAVLDPNYPEDLGGQFTEIFIKKQENVQMLLSLLEEYDFHVRWPTVKLLITLLGNRCKDLQEVVLVSPMGVSKMMDLLSDSREVIRNDGLLLLQQLTKGNANIQKIVAFENAFERLLEIIREEDNSDGGIVVEDCLLLLLNLLKNNASNQNFFKEGSYIQKIAPFFELQPVEKSPQGGWSAQKVTNIHLMLQVVRALVSPSSPAQQILSCQKVMNQCGLLQQLCSILMASGVPADVLTETINTVSEIIRGNTPNQEFFASVMAPSNPPRPAIVVLLMSMVNEKQPFVLRCAVLYCFQSFLYKNELGQSQIVQTLLPASADVNTISAGQLLCGGLFSSDSLSTWCAAIALLHSTLDNPSQKEQLLRVQLATSLGNPPVSLLQQCINILGQGAKFQTKVGLLQLLCNWLCNSTACVQAFLSNESNVPYLISQISASDGDEQEVLVQGLCAFLLGISVLYNNDETAGYTKETLRQVIEKRIGLEMYSDKLSQVSKVEGYSKAAKRPHVQYKQPNEVIFDYEFTKIYRALENEVLKAVHPLEEGELEQRRSFSQHEDIVVQYKELIREQDTALNKLKAEHAKLKQQFTDTENKLAETAEQMQQLKDQNSLLKIQKGTSSASSAQSSENSDELVELRNYVESQRKQLEERDKEIETLKNAVNSTETANPLLVNGLEDSTSIATDLENRVSHLQQELNQVQETLRAKTAEFETVNSNYAEATKQLENLKLQSNSETDSGGESSEMTSRISNLESKLTSVEAEKSQLETEKQTLLDRIKKSNEDNMTYIDKCQKCEDANEKLVSEKKLVEEDLDTIRKEQEDLLVLMADQEVKLKKYRERLKELGDKIEDDDDDDDDDFGDEDDDLDLEDGEPV